MAASESDQPCATECQAHEDSGCIRCSRLLGELQNPAHAVVFLSAGTGLRISEALALKWSDVDFRSGVINLKCAVVHQQIGEMKTEASQKPVPMAGELAAALQEWRTQTSYRQD